MNLKKRYIKPDYTSCQLDKMIVLLGTSNPGNDDVEDEDIPVWPINKSISSNTTTTFSNRTTISNENNTQNNGTFTSSSPF